MTIRRARLLGTLGWLVLAVPLIGGGQSAGGGREALVGIVIGADSTPVRGASVRLKFAATEVEAYTDGSGTFRFDALEPADYDVRVTSPGNAVLRLKLVVPRGGRLRLPPIRLPRPAFVRFKVLSPSGEPVPNWGVISESYDLSGRVIPRPDGDRLVPVTDADGVTALGPLPNGIFIFAIDAPPWGRTRAPEVRVTGERETLDLGTLRLDAGAKLEVDLVDQTNAPVPNEWVSLAPESAFSPERFPAVLTDATGRATFDRLGRGRYRVSARALRLCGYVRPVVARWVTVRGNASVRQRLPIGGVKMSVRLTTAGAPLASAPLSLSTDVTEPSVPSWLMDPDRWRLFSPPVYSSSGCEGMTDQHGAATIQYVPAGPAKISLSFASSTFVRTVSIPPEDGELSLDIPTGITSLRIVDADTGEPASAALVQWLSGGSEVVARVPATGDVLLDGILDGAASIIVTKQGYEPFKAELAGPPPTLHTIALRRLPDRTLRCRVQSEDGEPVANSVVELVASDPLQPVHLAGTDARGLVLFADVPEGTFRLTAMADGYVSARAAVSIPAAATLIPLTLRRIAAR